MRKLYMDVMITSTCSNISHITTQWSAPTPMYREFVGDVNTLLQKELAIVTTLS